MCAREEPMRSRRTGGCGSCPLADLCSMHYEGGLSCSPYHITAQKEMLLCVFEVQHIVQALCLGWGKQKVRNSVRISLRYTTAKVNVQHSVCMTLHSHEGTE